MTYGDPFCFVVQVFSIIYRGLNAIVWSLDPATVNVVFPAHVFGLFGEYFRIHFRTTGDLKHPLMTRYSGGGEAKH